MGKASIGVNFKVVAMGAEALLDEFRTLSRSILLKDRGGSFTHPFFSPIDALIKSSFSAPPHCFQESFNPWAEHGELS